MVRSKDWAWPFWPVFPLYPYGQRRTLRREVVRNQVWTFDQIQGIFYVVVPIRMTVVKLAAGGLLVYAPIAPTPECIRLVQELVAEHGEVRYIVLPTISGLEHKVFVGPFARYFPNAQVLIPPDQWSYPINLPLSWLGFPVNRTQVLSPTGGLLPGVEECEYALLGPLDLKLGKFGELALFHRPSQTLLLTDTVLSIPADPPAIVQLDPYPLLFHARDNAMAAMEDTQANRRKGWQRICLFALYLQPSSLEGRIDWGQVLRNATKAANRSQRAYFGLFPFNWKIHWLRSFESLRGEGRLLVPPILQTLILNRDPEATLNWVDRLADWPFHWIIPAHFDAPIVAAPQQLRQAFVFLEKSPSPNHLPPLPQEDFQFLRQVEQTLDQRGITPPAKELVERS